MSLSSVRTKLGTALSAISGVHVYTKWPVAINEYPAALIRPLHGDWKLTLPRQAGHYYWEITLAVPVTGLAEESQDALDGYLATTGTGSVKTAIEGYASYASDCSFARVIEWRDYGPIEPGGTIYMAVRFEVETW